MRSASAMLRPPSKILPTSRLNRALGTLVPREVSTKFNQYHVVPIHNSTVEDGKQHRITGLTLPRNQDNDETDLGEAEIVAGTASMSPTSGPEEGAVSPDNFFNASDKPNQMKLQYLQQTHSQQLEVIMNGRKDTSQMTTTVR